ncbi:MAG TPA: helix-turn-helix domain-containing protein [Microlunatus sp.]|nr:helix-turn-helix domain-containing protein [Microlunatus sp.]
MGGPDSHNGEAVALRTDALRNRERILQAARVLFAERGPDVPMAAIARRAEVGMATLYRRFPTKEELVAEVFADQFSSCQSLVDEALADPDPWRGFCLVVRQVCAMQALDRGFSAAFLTEFPEAVDVVTARERALAGFTRLVRRAQRAGALRRDFAPTDLALVLLANGGIVADTPEATLAASRRLVGYLLESFRADRSVAPGPLPPPVPLDLTSVFRLGRRTVDPA